MPFKRRQPRGEKCFDLHRIRLPDIPNNSVHIVIGRRGSGKTTLARSIASRFKDDDIVVVFSETEPGNRNWGGGWSNDTDTGKPVYKKPIVPYTHVFYRYDGDRVKGLIDSMMYQTPLPNGNMRRLLLVFDDCSYSRNFVNDSGLRYALMNGRNAWTDIIIVSQWMLALKPEMRSQIDYVWSLTDNNWSNIDRLHKHWYGVVRSDEAFNKIFKKMTANFGALVLANNSRSRELNELLFWYEANPKRDVVLGTRSFWIQCMMTRKSRETIASEQRRKIFGNGSEATVSVRKVR